MKEFALGHHWLVGMRGGEKVLLELCRLFPGAPIHTLVANRAALAPEFLRHRIVESPLRLLPGAARHYKKMLPLFPWAFRGLRVRGRPDMVLTSDASVAKGLTIPSGVPHVCYCHSPARYLWGMQEIYLRHTAGLGAPQRALFKAVIPYVRQFDLEAAGRVDHFIANSAFVQQRIRDCYGRDSEVIHPPVDIGAFEPGTPPGDFHLVVSELVPYKRIDIAVDAFNRLGRKLVIIGSGSELAGLRDRAKPNIRFLGRQPLPVLKQHYETCRAFIFPGIEDFGITPLEAQAAGRPVIAYAGGGALETVVEGRTGIFFREQTAEALAEAVEEFEKNSVNWPSILCRENAKGFSGEVFRAKMQVFLAKTLPDLFSGHAWPG